MDPLHSGSRGKHPAARPRVAFTSLPSQVLPSRLLRPRLVARVAVLAAVVVATVPAHAQPSVVAPPPDSVTHFPDVRFTGRVHVQGYYADNGPYAAAVGPSSTVFLRRVRLEARGFITPRIAFIVMPSYEQGRTGSVRLLDTYLDFRLTPLKSTENVVVWRVGNEKRPIGRYELTSSNNLPSLERGAGRGLVAAQSNDLFLGNNYLAWDIGTSLIWIGGSGRYSLQTGMYNGSGETSRDNNDSKAMGGRGTATVWRKLSVGTSYYVNNVVATDTTPRRDVAEVDFAWGRPGEPGLYLLGDFMQGQAQTTAGERLRGATLVAAYHVRNPGLRGLYALEPAVMLDVGDPDTSQPDNEAYLVRVLAAAYFARNAHLRVAYEHQTFADIRPSIGAVRAQVTVSW